MACLLLLAAALTVQDPSPAGTVDVIHLATGAELRGRIVSEEAGFVTIEIAPGTQIGLGESLMHGIERGVPVEAPLTSAVEGEPRTTWSVLHDAEGHAIGWLQESVTREADGARRYAEEWRFVTGAVRTELTLLEVVGDDGPRSCFLHERLRDAASDAVHSETIVRATVIEGPRLRVVLRGGAGRDVQEYDLPRGVRFPLELRAELRERPPGHHARTTHVVFDPRHQQFLEETFDIGRRREVEFRGERRSIRILTSESVHATNHEWLDGASRTIRREINGPTLVAVPTTEAEARRLSLNHAAGFPPAFAAEPGGEFGLWLPGPAWRFLDEQVPGQISAAAELDRARVALMRLAHVDPDLDGRSVGDAVIRWLRLLHPTLEVVARDAARPDLVARYRASDDLGRREVRIDLLRTRDAWFALCCDAPLAAAGSLAGDFEWIRRRVELHREGFAPTLRGPLAEQH